MSGVEEDDHNSNGRRVHGLTVKRSSSPEGYDIEDTAKKVKRDEDCLETGNEEDSDFLHPSIEYVVKLEGGEGSVSQYREWNNLEENVGSNSNEEIVVPIYTVGTNQSVNSDSEHELGDGFMQFCQSTTESKKYPCTETNCTVSFKTRKSLIIHKLSSHGSFHCMHCDFETNCARTFGQHGVQRHSTRISLTGINSTPDSAPFTVIQCFWTNCDWKAEKEDVIIAHVMKDHLEIPIKASKISRENAEGSMEGGASTLDLYKCLHCNVQKDSLRNVALHETRSHSNKVHYMTADGKRRHILVCARHECAWKLAEEEHLVLHILKCHEGIQLNQWEEEELNTANDNISKLVFFKSEEDNQDESYLGQLRPNGFECPSCTDTFTEESQLVAHNMLVHKLPISNETIFKQATDPFHFYHSVTPGSSKSMNTSFFPPIANSTKTVHHISASNEEIIVPIQSTSEEQHNRGNDSNPRTNQLEFVESASTPPKEDNHVQAVSSYPDANLKSKETKRFNIEVLSREQVTVLETKPITFSPRKTPKN